jgi:hypothetical protein
VNHHDGKGKCPEMLLKKRTLEPVNSLEFEENQNQNWSLKSFIPIVLKSRIKMLLFSGYACGREENPPRLMEIADLWTRTLKTHAKLIFFRALLSGTKCL